MNATLATHRQRCMALLLCAGIGSAAIAATSATKADDTDDVLQELAIDMLDSGMIRLIGLSLSDIVGLSWTIRS